MCKCTPTIRTPFCGKPGCEWPSHSHHYTQNGTIQEEPVKTEIESLKEQIEFLEKQMFTLSSDPNVPKDTIQMIKEDIRDLKLDLIILQTTK